MRRDGTDAEPGESGEVAITNLVNRATVLINYRLGDLASLSTKACSCGRNLRMIGSLDGRADDMIFLASGRTLPPRFVASPFKLLKGVRQYRLIQHGPREFEVKLVLADKRLTQRISAQVVAEFGRLLGEGAQVRITMCEEIPRPAHGKFRFVVSHAQPAWWTDPAGVSRGGGEIASRLA